MSRSPASVLLVTAALLLGLLGACGTPAAVPVEGLGGPCSPAVTLDRWSDSLDKATVGGTRVEGLSALAAERDGGLLALSDRSTLLTLDPRTRTPVAATPLADEHGGRLDSEALAVEADRTRLVTSETGPAVRAYDPAGRLIDQLPLPDALRTAPDGRATPNQSLEGLTLSPDGRTLTASFEGARSGDDPGVRRLVTWQRTADTPTGPARGFRLGPQYALRIDEGLDISDVVATPDGRLLVLERSYTDGIGNTVHLVLADPRAADDVAAVPAVSVRGSTQLATTTLLADLGACPAAGAPARGPQRNPLLDNIEGMTGTRVDGTGRLGVLAVSDDNGSAVQTTRLYDLQVALPAR